MKLTGSPPQNPGPSATVLFSVVITTFNCVAKLDGTVQSVLGQSGVTLECLVIDGGSTDGTLDRLRSFGERVRWISEADAGIYDAMNKGIGLAVGRFLYFLGAGDRLRPGVLALVAAEAGRRPPGTKPVLLYGNVVWSRHKRPYDGRFHRFKLLRRNLCHQAIFYERSIFARSGLYHTKYRWLADWAFNLRCFNDRGIEKHYLPLSIADYEGGGESNLTYDRAFHDDFRSLVLQGGGRLDRWLMRIAFLLAHPRALAGEPLRQARRLRNVLAKP